MHTIIDAEFPGHGVQGFFTGKEPGADLRRIAEVLCLPAVMIYMPLQRHTDKVYVLDRALEPAIADAVISKQKGIVLGVQVADCVPILLYDRVKQVIGAVHAGWRGTAARILGKSIGTMMERFCSLPEDILVAMGPSIRQCCYTVGYEVVDSVAKTVDKNSCVRRSGESYYLDLPSANRWQALSAGVSAEHIRISPECTFCSSDKFYSYRFSRGPTGRQGGFIGIL